VNMKRWGSFCPGFVFMVCILTAFAFPQKAPEWKGKIEKEGDVVVVRNPRLPQYGSAAFSLVQDLAIGGQDNPDSTLAEITSIAVDSQGQIFILDGKDGNVKVFGRDGKYVTSFGKAGQGPGEFDHPRTIQCFAKDEIVVLSLNRISFFGPKMNHLRDVPSAGLILMDAHIDSLGNILGFYYLIEATGQGNYELGKFDGVLKKLFVMESSPLPNIQRDGYDPFFPVLRWAILPDDRVVCGYAVKPEVRVHGPNGRVVRKIQMDPEPIPMIPQDIKERTEGALPDMLKNMNVPKHFPSFRYLITDDEGRIYVLSWGRPPDRKGYYFDVFDSEGRYIVRTILPALIPHIRKGRLYSAEETGEGYPVLKRYTIRWRF